ncbi:CLUMA_CG008804, isoform A [Clunio marinus]|uniref:CLUMA_CG008804, isoform A n=1 Tax=Clunio marinus TaxID=568069 RepID=A0A1J1I4W1_9DIPT|nr:CLUMA_CG008804, isoform A [Clunio marinus]
MFYELHSFKHKTRGTSGDHKTYQLATVCCIAVVKLKKENQNCENIFKKCFHRFISEVKVKHSVEMLFTV